MVDLPQVNKLQTLVERQLNKNRRQSSSAASSIHSNNSFGISGSSLYASSIEKQLQSLVCDDKHKDTTELLKQTFNQLRSNEDNDGDYSARNSLAINTTLKDDVHSNDNIIQDFSVFALPFKERPSIVVGKNMDYYIPPPPTSNRKYLDPPDADILKSMNLPYPFRIKEPVSQRLGRMKNAPRDYKEPIRPSKRHSLALGQVDQIFKDKVDTKAEPIRLDQSKLLGETYNHPNLQSRKRSDQHLRSIMTWMPEQPTVWNNWMDTDYLIPNYSDSLHPLRPSVSSQSNKQITLEK